MELDVAQNYDGLTACLKDFQPETVVHYGEQPSAPYSMLRQAAAEFTLRNNTVGTLNLGLALREYVPDCHVIKLGTIGEYGTPNVPIPEGWLDIELDGRSDRLMFPQKPGSLYHVSKVCDSQILEFMSRIQGLRVTDLNQGVVYGHRTDGQPESTFATSFHYDGIFGTVLNRFIVEAASERPLSI